MRVKEVRELAMLAYTIHRLLLIIPVMLVVATTVFLLLFLTPGDPVGVILGPDATEQQKADLRAQLGLDQAAHVQLLRWHGGCCRAISGPRFSSTRQSPPRFWNALSPP